MDGKLKLMGVYRILSKYSGDNAIVKATIADSVMSRLELNMRLRTVRDIMGMDISGIPSITNLLSTMVAEGWVVSGRNDANGRLYSDILKYMSQLNNCAKKCVSFLRDFDIVCEQDIVVIDMVSLVPHEYVAYPPCVSTIQPYKRKLDVMNDVDPGCSSDVQKRSRSQTIMRSFC